MNKDTTVFGPNYPVSSIKSNNIKNFGGNLVKPDSIGFDLDGTLWDSMSAITDAWKLTSEEYGVPAPTNEEMQSVMGLNKTQLMTKLFPEFSEKQKDEFFDRSTEFCDEILNKRGGILYPDLEETLAELSEQVKLYIVSNCQNGYIETFLRFHKLNKYFCDFECSGTKCLPKGENIRLVMKRNDFTKSLYIGDTQGDCDAAKLANVPFVFASYGFGTVKSYNYKIDSLPEIKGLIQLWKS